MSAIDLHPPIYRESRWNHHDLELCVYTWGSPNAEKPTLMFLHGWLDHGASWNTVATQLATLGYHCIAIDHRGHGHSDHIPLFEEYHFIDYLNDLQQFIHAQTLDSFVLIGHSMGGTIASIYSALCTPSPGRCILVDGLGPKHETPAEATHRLKLHLSQRRRQSQHRPMSFDSAVKKLHRAHPFLSTPSLQQEVRRLTTTITQDPDAKYIWKWDPRHRNKSAIGFSLPRFLDTLQHISCPTDCIFGQHSWYLQLPDLPSRLKALPSLETTIRLPSGHSPHLECPLLLAEAIDQCIQQQ